MEYVVLLAVLIGIATFWYLHRRKRFRIFKDLGIPGPEPNWLIGNLKELNQKTIPGALASWKEKFGRTFGYYFGAVPFLVVMDTEVLKQIQIKDFHSFINRPNLVPGGILSDEKYNSHVASEGDERWKHQRAILTPTFTSGKMKQMLPHMDQAVDVLLGKIDKCSQSDKEFDIYEMFKGLTLDVISRTAFGTETNVQLNPKDPFLLGAKELLTEGPPPWPVVASLCFPELHSVIYPIRKLSEVVKYYLSISHVRDMCLRCVDMIRWRRADPKNRREDLLQLLLDAEMSSDVSNITGDSLTAGYESESKCILQKALHGDNNTRTSRGLSETEVVSNSIIFVFAGYETTSTALGFAAHVLVNHPDIQEKIRTEIQNVETEDGKLDYLSLSKMKYLDIVLSEVLRYFPPVTTFVTRECKKEVTYGDLRIPKGVTVLVPVSLLHKDPTYWSEPEKFEPERFLPENRGKINSMAYQPFGAGPRNCIGMRFAQMEAKLALARILTQYRLVASENTELGDLEINFKVAVSTPKNGVLLKAEKL